MRGNKLMTRPARIDDPVFDDLYDEISRDWQRRAARLQARRWRRLEQEQRWHRYKDNEFLRYKLNNGFRGN